MLLGDYQFYITLAGQFQACLYTPAGRARDLGKSDDPNPWGAPTGAQQSMRNLSSGSYVLKRQTQPICGTLSTPPPPPPASRNSGSYSHGPIEFKIEEGDRFNIYILYHCI